jgi:two-component system, NarL family, sensor kinase
LRASTSKRSPTVASAVVKFALAGLAAMVVVGAAGVIVFQRAGTDLAIQEARNVTRFAGVGIVQPLLTDELVRGDKETLAALDEAMRQQVLIDPFVRVKIWTGEGRIIYSDEPALIGQTFSLGSDEVQALRARQTKAEISDLSGPENRYETRFDELLEVYLPVWTPGGQQLLFEAYLRFSSVSENARHIWLAFLPVLVLALLLLGLLQIPLAWSMARRIQEGRRDREDLLRRAIEASDLERRRIASDLHDGAVQGLAGLSMALAAKADRLEGEAPAEATDALREAAGRTRQNMRELRSLLVGIHPPNLHTEGLPAALQDLVSPLTAQGVEVEVDVRPGLNLPPEVESLLFRACQESIRNILEHANAGRVGVRVSSFDHHAYLTVEDDGRGFSRLEEDRARAEGHIGLRLLSDLVADAGGTLHVKSRPGAGTELRLEVPTG